jgi:site-specific recombinase XerD
MTGIHGLEPMSPREGVNKYVEARRGELSQSTVYEHTTRLNRFLEWCDDEGIDNLNSLSARKCHDFMASRQDNVAPTTLENEMRTFRLAVEVWENLDAVAEGIAKKVKVPNAKKGDRSRTVKLNPSHAQAILEYLDTYEYATFRHAMFAIFWDTGCRTSGLKALDLGDFYPERYTKPLIEFCHRPETGTPLKNDRWGEREVYIHDWAAKVLQDYIKVHREDVSDDHGRQPLLTTKNGRPNKTTIQRNVYQLTRPCVIGLDCPESRDPNECEAMTYNGASKCPDSVSPHAIRRGFVTHLRDNEVPFEELGDRVDASPETLREHYDTPTPQEKRDRQLQVLDKF